MNFELKQMKKILILIFLTFRLSFAFADINNDLMMSAGKAYSKQDYNKAIELYKKVIDNGYKSFELYYNIGNSYFKLNQLPFAILYFEKAKKLNPADEDIKFNLTIANRRIVDKIDVLPELFIKTWWKSLVNYYNTDQWASLTVISLCLCIVLLLLFLLGTSHFVRRFAFWLSVFMLLISILCVVFARHQFNEVQKVKEAIIFTPTLNVKSSPDQNSTDIFVIHEGLKVKIIDQVGDWYDIQIANGSKGWIRITDMEII
jgi:tetratricopeptide (TPR) repeat protein